MSSGSSESDHAITRVLGDGDTTLVPGPPARGGLSVVAQKLFRQPLNPVRLSRYILLEQLGQGAFGAVYAAYDPELNRKVAIKLMVPRVDDEGDEGRDRLLREAQAMAHFSHPNVVAVHDVGTYSLDPSIREEVSEIVREGVFLVMELVDGVRMDEWARGRTGRWREIVENAIEAARGLAAAHEAGLVHRDFKPANVLVDRADHPKILDFGLARLHGSAPSSSTSSHGDRVLESLHDASEIDDRLAADLTRTGTVVGTPRYMPPEQHQGQESEAIADQYSFCVTLYELLYGKAPFRGRKLDELIRAKLDLDSLRPPSGRAPAWVFRVIRRGLEPDPAARHPDMHALIDALQRDPARRRRRVLLGAGLVTATIGLGAATSYLAAPETSPCENVVAELAGVWDPELSGRAEAAFEATGLPHADQSWTSVSATLDEWATEWTEQRVALCEASRRPDAPSAEQQGQRLICLERHRRRVAGLTRVLGEADDEVVAAAGLMASEIESPEACTRLTAPTTRESLATDSEVAEAEEAVAEARALMAVGKTSNALATSLRAVELAAVLDDHHLRSRAHLVLASTLLHEEADGAREEAQRAIELAEQVGDDELACEGLVVLMRALADGGDHDGADLVARLAISRAEATMVGDRVAAMLAYHLGATRLRQGRYSEGRPHLQHARELRERMFGPEHPLVAQVDNALGVAYYRDGMRDEAYASFQRAILGFTRTLGPEHPQLGRVYNNLGNYWSAAGKYEEAYEQLTHSARIVAANDPPQAPSHATAHENLALVARAQGQRTKALRHLEKAEQVRLARLNEDHPDVMRVRSRRAGVLESLGRDDEAQQVLQEVLRDQRRTLGPDHSDTLDTSFALAESLVEGGRQEEGLRLAEDALRVAEEAAPGSDELGRWLVVVARIANAQDRLDDAERAAIRALELLRFDTGEASPVLSQAHMVRGDVSMKRSEPIAAESSFSTALTMYEEMFGSDHGRLGWPLSRRAEAREAAGDRAGARDDLERAVRLTADYDGPELQRPGFRFHLARLLPASERARAMELLDEARAEIRAARDDAPPSVLSSADELERAMAAWADGTATK